MNISTCRRAGVLAAAWGIAALVAALPAAAQTWSTRPVTMVVPFAAGGGSITPPSACDADA
jgi:tripartite-type tricarboxylate transporter receptor subunit TctC